MENRPDFADIKTFEEFSLYYWYREELQKICKSLGIDSTGMKAELNHNIKEYFHGNRILPKNRVNGTGRKFEDKALLMNSASCKKGNRKSPSKTSVELNLQTSLIECGFTFGPRFRDFFIEQTGVKNFKFNVDMVATVKKVKEDGDSTFTLGDLLDIYYGKKTYAKYDKVSLQWNKFVKDFCADEATAVFQNKIKTASILWKEVRNSTREKVYKHELLTEFADIIK